MSGAHVDIMWPVDGPARNGRMAWPPYVGTHRAEPATGFFPQQFADEVTSHLLDAARRTAQVVKDVWSGNADTDKFWAKNEPVNENFD